MTHFTPLEIVRSFYNNNDNKNINSNDKNNNLTIILYHYCHYNHYKK